MFVAGGLGYSVEPLIGDHGRVGDCCDDRDEGRYGEYCGASVPGGNISGALSKTDGARETGRELALGWYDRAGEVGLGEGGTEFVLIDAFVSSLLLKRTLVIFGRGRVLFFEMELSTSCNKLLISLSAAGGACSSCRTSSPDNLALARANTS